MVFIPDSVPTPDQSLDSDARYVADVPFDLKQAEITMRRHRWFQPVVIDSADGTRGLDAGQQFRMQFDNRPDWIVVSISGETAATGRADVYLGDPGGPAFRVGAGAKLVIPAPVGGIISIVNRGTTRTYGVVTAVAGFTDPGIDITLGG